MLYFLVVVVLLASPVAYLLHHAVLSYICRPRDLKRAYGAEWALITGASSGIGKAMAVKLAGQGLNIVLVALPDSHLQETYAFLSKSYPGIACRAVGVDLGKPGYLARVSDATSDIDVQIVICNAGYMLTGFFETRGMHQHLANMECNATNAVAITHHFLTLMLGKQLQGCFVFTSSAAATILSPMTVMYSATKAFLSYFGASLAAEVRHAGIDVLVLHPGAVNTRFYNRLHTLQILEFFRGQALQVETLPDVMLASLGRTVWRDVGSTAVVFRLLLKLIDYNFLASFIALVAPLMPDFKMLRACGNKELAQRLRHPPGQGMKTLQKKHHQ